MPAAIASIRTSGGWLPTAFNEVPVAYMTYSNYSAVIDLGTYTDAPFLLLTPQDSEHASDTEPYDVIFFDGEEYDWIKRGGSSGGAATVIQNDILTQYTFTSNGLQDSKYYILT